MTTPADIIATARAWHGTPWVHRGRGDRGIDCAGLLRVVAKAHALTDHDVIGYSRMPDGYSLEQALIDAGCTPCQRRPGAAVVLYFRRLPQHLGLLTAHPLGGLGLLHAMPAGVVEHVLDWRWAGRIVSTWALPRVEYPA